MADSLILAESIELMNGGVPSVIAACAGAVFRLAPGFDLSEPQPTSDYIATLVLDGEKPTGRRASNRTVTLPVVITAPLATTTDAQRTTLIAAREVLLRAIDKETFTLRWTREGAGFSTLFDCYRASAAAPVYDTGSEKQGVVQLTISFPAAPYARSDTPVTVAFQSPLAGQSAPASPVTIDSYSSVAGTSWSQSLIGPGPDSAHWVPSNGTGAGLAATYSKTGLSLNLTGLTAVTLYAGFGSSAYFASWCQKGGPVHFLLTLTDSSARVLSSSRIETVYGSNNPATPKFAKVRIPIPASAVFNFAGVAAYSLTVTNRGTNDLQFTELYLDSLTAVPPATQAATLQRGVVYDLAGMTGSARCAPSFQFQQPGSAVLVTRTLSQPGGLGQSLGEWTAPPLVTSVAVRCWGSGGNGSTVSSAGGGGGGGGGTAYNAAVAVTPGSGYSYSIAFGGSGSSGTTAFTGDSATVTAHSGANAAANSTTGAAGGTAGTGGYAGGAGGLGDTGTSGGGGGSSAGTGAIGGAGAAGSAGGAGGTPPAGGAAGGYGRPTAGGPNDNGVMPGGGGGGGLNTPSNLNAGGGGANGQITLSYLQPPLFNTLIAHRPGFYADQNLCPFVTPNPGDQANGLTEYPVTSLITGVTARFNSTYSVVAVANTWNSPASSRTVTVTVKQYEQPGGAPYTQLVSWTFTPSLLPLGSPFVVLGNLTIPLNELPPDNLNAYYTVTLGSTNTADTFYDVLFLDTRGSTVMLCTPNSYVNMFIDEPFGSRDIGFVTGSMFGREDGISVLAGAQAISGGPLTADPDGNQSLLVYSVQGAPSCQMTYMPRWLLDRLS